VDRPARDERLAAAAHRAPARVLLRNGDGTVALEGETTLVAECDGLALDHVVRGVSTFALAVASIVGALAVTGVAPRPVALFAVTWIVAAVVARRWAARRRREHGRITIDLDARVVHAATRSEARDLPLDDSVAIELEAPDDPPDHPRWLLLRRGADRLRLAHGRPEELRGVLYVLRRHGVRAPAA
jgi:hypothetical protein